MDPSKKQDTSMSLDELIKRDRMKAKNTKKVTLKPKAGAKKVLTKKPLPPTKGSKTLNMKKSDKKQTPRPDLKVHRKIIQKGTGKPLKNLNPERKGGNAPARGGKAPMQQRPGGHGKVSLEALNPFER